MNDAGPTSEGATTEPLVAPQAEFQSVCSLTRSDQRAIVFLILVSVLGASWWQRSSTSNAMLDEPLAIDRQIDLNTATAAELDLLDGIGPKLSVRILEDRMTRGPFTSVDALRRVKGIGPKTLEKNRDSLRTEPDE